MFFTLIDTRSEKQKKLIRTCALMKFERLLNQYCTGAIRIRKRCRQGHNESAGMPEWFSGDMLAKPEGFCTTTQVHKLMVLCCTDF